MIKFKGLSDKLIIVKDEAEEKSGGGIIIPELSQKRPFIGTVLAKGPGSMRKTAGSKYDMTEIEVGKKYVFEHHEGFNFKIWSKSYLAISIRKVLAELP